MKALWPELDDLAALETGRYWTPAHSPSEPLYRPAVNNGHWAGDILTNGLVLYIPMWLYSGAKFPSVDAYHRICTVTGATWGLQGRSFNGSNQKIVTNAALAAPIGAAARALIVWFKPGRVTDNEGFVFWGGQAANNPFYIMKESANIGIGNWGGVGETMTADDPLEADKWYLGAALFDGVTATFHLFGSSGLIETVSASRSFNTSSTVVSIGCLATQYNYFQATIGEVAIYTSALSLAEITHSYNATRWRYA